MTKYSRQVSIIEVYEKSEIIMHKLKSKGFNLILILFDYLIIIVRYMMLLLIHPTLALRWSVIGTHSHARAVGTRNEDKALSKNNFYKMVPSAGGRKFSGH